MKPLHFIASSRDDLSTFPRQARADAGFALYLAQSGGKSFDAVPLTGFGGAKVLEIRIDERSDTYRVVYTVMFAEAIYVLHAFKKKSKQGIKTPRPEIDRIRERLKLAEKHYVTSYGRN